MAKVIDLEGLKDFRQKYDERLKNGSLVPAQSDFTNNIIPVSQESGDIQETPFVLQGTGTANGTVVVDTGKTGQHIEKQGSVYCVNQYVQGLIATTTQNGVTFTNNGDGSLTINGTNSDANNSFDITLLTSNLPMVNGHKYIWGTKNGSLLNIYLLFTTTQYLNGHDFIISDSTESSNNKKMRLRVGAGETINNVTIFPQFIDLTQWFNGNIPSTLTADNFGLYHNYGDYIPYNTGSLVASNGRYLVTTGRNQFDEIIEGGRWSYTDESPVDSIHDLRSKNFIQVVGGKSYRLQTALSISNNKSIIVYEYDKNKKIITYQAKNGTTYSNFDLSNETKFIRFSIYMNNSNWATNLPTKEQAQIVFSLYYAGEDYSQYYPYEQPNVYDTGTETLLSTCVKLNAQGEREDAYDYKEPSGVIHRVVGSTDLGNKTWEWSSTNQAWNTVYKQTQIKAVNLNTIPNFLCVGYQPNQEGSAYLVGKDNIVFISSSGYLYIRDNTNLPSTKTPTEVKEFLTGKILYFELATTTTEQGTPFSENILINDFGTMGWYSTDTETSVDVPQGCKIFYPAWYAGFVDTLGNRADIDWDANDIVSQQQLCANETERNTVDAQLLNAIGGTLRQLLASSQSVDFDNTDVIDLGVQDWSTYGSYTNFDRYISNAINSAPNNAKALCSKYKTITTFTDSLENANSVYIGTGNGKLSVLVAKNTYANADTFKAAMKGVLLAYKKA